MNKVIEVVLVFSKKNDFGPKNCLMVWRGTEK